MTVYFVYRCHYMGPTEKYLKRFDQDDSVLDWIRNRWDRMYGTDSEVVSRKVDREIGRRVYSLYDIFWNNPEYPDRPGGGPPKNARQLRDLFTKTYHNLVVCQSEHCVQVLTDDDELDMAYCFFDEHYLNEHADKAAFLLHDDWKLPGDHAATPSRPAEKSRRRGKVAGGKGATYLVFLGFYNSGGNLEDMDTTAGGDRVDGVRLPDFPRFLIRRTLDPAWPGELVDLRPVLVAEGKRRPAMERAFLQDIRARPDDDLAWNAYSDWLQDRGDSPAGPHLLRQAMTRLGHAKEIEGPLGVNTHDLLALPIEEAYQAARPMIDTLDRHRGRGKSLIHVEDHLAQMCLYVGYDKWHKCNMYHQWILFDDLWAGAHPVLAEAILCFGRRWDVLSTTKNPPRMD